MKKYIKSSEDMPKAQDILSMYRDVLSAEIPALDDVIFNVKSVLNPDYSVDKNEISGNEYDILHLKTSQQHIESAIQALDKAAFALHDLEEVLK